MAALMVATGDPSRGHVLPGRPGAEQLIDWLRAVGQLPPALRAEAHPSVSSLLEDLGGRDRQVVDAAALTLAGITRSADRGFERLAGLAADPSIGIAALEGLGALTANEPDAWPADAGEEKLVGPILAAMRKAPPGELASPRYRRIHDLGLRIADRLTDRGGDAVGGDLREELVNLAAASVTLRTVPYSMVFDIAEFTVRAGRPVEISFENTDGKPHNVAIVRPGALDEVGRAADDWAERDPVGAEAAGYVPETPLVVLQTGMVHPGETEVLRFDAPQLPGLYAFACTFPGHWVSMNGALAALDARGAGVRDLAGLERAVNLEGLDLGLNPLADVRALESLPALRTLNLDGTFVDPWALAALARLERLSLRDNGIEDLAGLASLTALRVLDVGGNRIADFSALDGNRTLRILGQEAQRQLRDALH